MKEIMIEFNKYGTVWNHHKLKQGENLSHELVVNLDDELLGYKYILKFQNNNNKEVVTPELQAVNSQVRQVVTNALTKDPGVLKVELNAFDDEGLLIKTYMVLLSVVETLGDTEDVMPEAYVPWYQEAVRQATIATEKAQEVEERLSRININTWQDLLDL